MANLAERPGADCEQVRQDLGANPRKNHDFIYPGIGHGGSCFPRTWGLIQTAGATGHRASLIEVRTGGQHRAENRAL